MTSAKLQAKPAAQVRIYDMLRKWRKSWLVDAQSEWWMESFRTPLELLMDVPLCKMLSKKLSGRLKEHALAHILYYDSKGDIYVCMEVKS